MTANARKGENISRYLSSLLVLTVIWSGQVKMGADHSSGSKWTVHGDQRWHRIYSLFFLDLNQGWAVDSTWTGKIADLGGARNDLYATKDSGKTWNYKGSLPFLPEKILFISESQGFAVSGISHSIAKTDDEGRHWVLYNLHPPRIIKASAVDSLTFLPCEVVGIDRLKIWVVLGGHFFMTNDGGDTWKSRSEIEGVYSVSKGSGSFGLALTNAGCIYRTYDGGDSWQFLTNTPHSTDGTSRLPSVSNKFRAIKTMNENQAWLFQGGRVGDAVYHTDNGGKSWEPYQIRGLDKNQSESLSWSDTDSRAGFGWGVCRIGGTDDGVVYYDANGAFFQGFINPSPRLAYPMTGPTTNTIWLAIGTGAIGKFSTGEAHMSPQ